jgi:hypothetical protein
LSFSPTGILKDTGILKEGEELELDMAVDVFVEEGGS